MQEIKVLHIITGGLQREGISSTLLTFFQTMNSKRIKIYVAAVHNNDESVIKDYEKCGCSVIVFPDRKRETFSYFLTLLRSLKKEKINIIHVHGSSAIMSIELLAAWITGVKIRIAHSRNTKADQVKLDKILRPLFNRLYTDGLACGEDAGKWLFGNKPYTIIHNGKEFEKFHFDAQLRKQKREEYGLQDKIVIGHVGVFNYQKNHEYLIDIFDEFQKRNPNAILYLMGRGELMECIETEVKHRNLSDKVVFAGSVNDVPERLQAMDIMVFPSRFEGLPNVVLEWQAEGLPALISDKITRECAPADFVEFASIDESPVIWAKKMEEMLNRYGDRVDQAKCGTKALKENGFDIKDAASQLESIYETLGSKIQ